MAVQHNLAENAAAPLDLLLRGAVDALTALDAAAVETLADELAAGVRPPAPRSAAEWRRAAHWRAVLGHLLGATAGRLAILRRVAEPGPRFGGYAAPDPRGCRFPVAAIPDRFPERADRGHSAGRDAGR
jgi:hypothetical protein